VRAFIRRHKKLTVAVTAILTLILWIWSPLAYTRGKLAAHRDIARGRYVVLGYGLPTEDRPTYAQLLKKRYGIEFRVVAGCIVSKPLMDYSNGYDEVSSAAIKRKFGSDVFKETYLAAQGMRAASVAGAKSN
jgi:hypothetical protein